MKFMFASDIHGSLYYAEKLMERFSAEKPEKLFVLGDFLYHGPRNDIPKGYDTKALAALLNRYKKDIVGVRGNCDADIDQVMLEFPMMADYMMLFSDGISMVLTHGHIFDENSMIPHGPGTVLLHGHTHLKVSEKCGDFYYINPGSVSIPKDDNEHSYLLYEDRKFTFKNLEGEVLREFTVNL